MSLIINSERLWDSLMELAKIGATDKGGVRRLALTDLDRQARDLVIRWCREAGCTRQGGCGGQHLRASRRAGRQPAAHHHRQPHRHAALRRQVRRQLRRAVGSRGHPHPQRPADHDPRSGRAGGMDQRRGLAIYARDDGVRGLRRRVPAGHGAAARRHRRHHGRRCAEADRLCRHREGGRSSGRSVLRGAHRAGPDPRGRAQGPGRRGGGAGPALVRRGDRAARTRTRGPRRCACAGTRCWWPRES